MIGRDIVVAADGMARWAGRRYRCAIGRGGIRVNKTEGDGATPVGRFALRRVLYRPDRLPAPPRCHLPIVEIEPQDVWCDDPADAFYNRPIRLRSGARHERLWRQDHRYDVIVVVGHNDDPPVSGWGSAIFIHLATEAFGPTAGCVAFERTDLLEILADCDAGCRLLVEAG
ncbi:MAG: L,D-transpeptidase family protein [Dongiaceae bacterium]